MDAGAGQPAQRPFPGQAEEAEDEVEDLQDGDGLDGAVEIRGQEVPEDFGPEEAFEGGGDLVRGRGEDDEARPVVFDQLAHRREWVRDEPAWERAGEENGLVDGDGEERDARVRVEERRYSVRFDMVFGIL